MERSNSRAIELETLGDRGRRGKSRGRVSCVSGTLDPCAGGSGLEREVEQAGAPGPGAVVHAAEKQPRAERAQLAQDAAQGKRILGDVVVELQAGTGAVDRGRGRDPE